MGTQFDVYIDGKVVATFANEKEALAFRYGVLTMSPETRIAIKEVVIRMAKK